MSLGEVSKGRENYLNIVRLLAAVIVVFSHAFPISNGVEFHDPMYAASRGNATLGTLALCVFFFIGGFLIMGSCERSNNGTSFFRKRTIRLFPSLIAVVLFSVFIMGPFFTNMSITEYLLNSETYRYLLNALLIPIHNLPGVFVHNIYGPTVNGPLWTLSIEFVCYILCYILYKLHITEKKYMKYSIPVFAIGYIAVNYLLADAGVINDALPPMGMFYIGMLYYVYRDNIRISAWAALCMGAILGISIPFGLLKYTIMFALPYVMAYICFGFKGHFIGFSKMPDISYQLYLVAWPIQQIVCLLAGGKMNPWLNFVYTFPIAVIAAVLLYKLNNTISFKNERVS